jgi:hypothetical protein
MNLIQLPKRAWSALFPVPAVGNAEAVLLRVLLGCALWNFMLPGMDQVTQPAPVGLAHFFDLTWLARDGNYAAYKQVFLLLTFWFATGVGLSLALPLLAILHLLPYTLLNSQAHPHHDRQSLSLACGVFYTL